MPNADRRLVHLVRRAADELGLTCDVLSLGWVIALSDGDRTRHVFGYRFDLNPAAADRIATDKAAASIVLARAGVACVPHTLHPSPAVYEFLNVTDGGDAFRAEAEALLRDHRELIVKPNQGTGGRGVSRVGDTERLHEHCAALFDAGCRGVALSPFVDAVREVRCVVLDGEPRITYAKTPPAGDWRHNLGLGGAATPIDHPAVDALAVDAAAAIGLRYAAIDVLESHDGTLHVLEANAGSMTEGLLTQHPALEPRVYAVYRDAVAAMFA